MSEGAIHTESREGLTILRLDRPPANAIDLIFGTKLDERLAELESDDGTSALILTGSGNCFSAGLDLRVIPTYSEKEQRQLVELLNRLFLRLYSFPVPTVAALNGHAIAGGMILNLCCDYRVAPLGDSRFGLAEVRVGIPYPVGAMSVVLAELPAPAARLMVQLGRNMDATQAVEHGVVDEAVEVHQVLVTAERMARKFAEMPPLAYRRIKRQVRAEVIQRVERVIADGSDPALDSWITPEGAKAASDVLAGKRRD
jgi:enoyl-CoA hydratase/carnithine racemase